MALVIIVLISVRLVVHCHRVLLFRSHRPRADRRWPRGWSVTQGPRACGPRHVSVADKDAETNEQPRSESG